ncbi:kinesin-like protein KIF19 isoform X2 [Clupea harengus]|uniref:Kinesin-like protein KIF19 n=1 Tax=Clupea harengus TaxID=7950 RepID=A0A6P8EZA5_CLUHA|nr:kinesin-like protein KIF19 isoform X2 [Clupea harengus]
MKDLPEESKDHQLTVALRIRPLNEAESDEGASVVAQRVDDQMVVLMDPCEDTENHLRANRSREKTYMFDVAFDQQAQQEEVYVATTKNLIEGVIAGYNATVFAYGPTGAGKTYTMLGVDSEPGIYVRTLNDLFKDIEACKDEMDCSVYMSYLEIYNEMIRDLLNPSSGYLDLREDAKGEIRIAGITEFSTSCAKEIMALLTKGNKQRTQEPTAANKTSSRSHAILQVTVKQRSRVKNINEEVRMGKLFMVDLAGTERASQTQNRGMRMKEGAHINRSLLALANCINALSERGGRGAQFVNYRDSKLTRLLKDALGGNSRTVMIAHISPASTNFEESRNTLMYADKAKNIKTKVKRNLFNVSYHLAQYTNIIAELRKEIERLRAKIDEQGQEQKKGEKADIRDVQAEVKEYSRREMAHLREQLLSAFREQMEIRRSLMELENCSMELHIDTSRHLATISDWERERTHYMRRHRDNRRGEKRDRGKDEEEEEEENEEVEEEESGGEEVAVEHQDVTAAREELGPLLAEQRKTMAMKVELEEKLASMKQKSSRLEELLPRRVANADQRELLSLLCQTHELELENTELQAAGLRRQHALRHRDFLLQRHEQRRHLAEDIIHQQRAVIQGHGLAVPEGLQQLYSLYLSELSEGGMDQLLNLLTVTSTSITDDSILTVAKQLKLDELVSEILHGNQSDLSPRAGNGKGSVAGASQQAAASSSSGPDNDSDSNKVFKSPGKPRAPRRRPVSSSPPPVTQPTEGKVVSAVSADTLREMASDTKSISVIAAKRKSRIKASSNRERSQSLERGLGPVTSAALIPTASPDTQPPSADPHGASATESATVPKTPAFSTATITKATGSAIAVAARRGLRAAGSVDSLSVSTPEEEKPGEAKRKPAGTGQTVSKRDPPRPERRNESPERQQTRRRRSKSFDVNGKWKPKVGPYKNPLLESVSDNRLVRPSPASVQPLLSSAGNPTTPPTAKVKYPVSHHTESQLQKLEIRGTPPITIHQRNQDGRIGHTLHRRVRGPTEPSGSSHLLLQPGNYKKKGNNNARLKASHDVNSKRTDNRLKKTAP